MKILNEFVPTRKFLKLAEEIKDLVDGWNVTDSAAGSVALSPQDVTQRGHTGYRRFGLSNGTLKLSVGNPSRCSKKILS
jgi:hypothetical protein